MYHYIKKLAYSTSSFTGGDSSEFVAIGDDFIVLYCSLSCLYKRISPRVKSKYTRNPSATSLHKFISVIVLSRLFCTLFLCGLSGMFVNCVVVKCCTHDSKMLITVGCAGNTASYNIISTSCSEYNIINELILANF